MSQLFEVQSPFVEQTSPTAALVPAPPLAAAHFPVPVSQLSEVHSQFVVQSSPWSPLTLLLLPVPAPEPADVLFENQGEYKKPCFHELRLLASIGIVVMVLALSLTTVILVHISKESVTPNRDTEQL